jgi:hypothetical protein
MATTPIWTAEIVFIFHHPLADLDPAADTTSARAGRFSDRRPRPGGAGSLAWT